MKRFFSSAIAMIFVFAMLMPGTVKAQTGTKVELQQAIQIAKQALNINDSGYNFNSNYSESNNRKSWYLSWNSTTNGNISVTVDADTGEILNYYSWKPDNETTSRIPKYTEDEAKKAAINFLEKVAPDKFKQTKEIENKNGTYNMNDIYYNPDYNFTFVRLVNGIPYRNNQITVSVGKNTLEVHSYYLNWDNITFPDSKASISNDEAIKIFKDKLGLKLQYNLVYSQVYDGNSSKPQAILVYSIYKNSPIDALTGEVIDSNSYYSTAYGVAGNKEMGMGSTYNDLSPQEQKAVENTGKYMTKDKALQIVKNSLPFTIGNEYKLDSANLYSDYTGTSANWNFSFSYNKDNNYNYISASVDAVTGELKSFYRGGSDIDNIQGKETKYTKEQAKKIAEDYLNKIQPDKFKQVEYQDININESKVSSYQFNYVYKANGILCPFNTISINVSPYTGEITNYYINWISVELPSAQNIISSDEAYNILFNNADFGLNYIAIYDYTKSEPQNPEIKLAYQLNDFYNFIDAKTGQIVDYNGKPITSGTNIEFTDINNNWAEKDIKLLAQLGIADGKDGKFYPDNNILQKDFIKMLVKTIQPVYEPIPLKSGDDYDNYYNIAIQKKIITEKEKKPDTLVTRQDAAKFLVRSFGVNFIADLNNIFTLNFKDANKISSSLRGYVAIASGLKLMNGSDGYFNPDSNLTRAEAAAILVRYLMLDK